MNEITVLDYANDRLRCSISDFTESLILEPQEAYNVSQWIFEKSNTEGIRELRDFLTTWLDDEQPAKTGVRASDISFNEGMLRLAAAHKKPVTFRYAKGGGGVIETRTLIPMTVAKVGDHMTFTGFDTDRDEPRAYRVDRMMGQVTVA